MGGRVGGFRSEASEKHFMQVFDAAMKHWPDRSDRCVETDFGHTVASVAGHASSTDVLPPLVLLQGGGSTIAAWAEFVRSWSRERQIIAVDTLWEAGRSVQLRPVDNGSQAAEWLEQVLAGLGVDRAHIAGYSYGAWLALNHAAKAPTRILSVTAIEPIAAITPMPLRAWWRMIRMLIGGEKSYRAYLQWTRGGSLPESAMLEVLLSSRAGYQQWGTPRPMRLTKAEWQSLSLPTSIVLGGQSGMVPTRKATETLRAVAPQAEVHVLPQSSHAVLIDEPNWIEHQIGLFMNRNDRTR